MSLFESSLKKIIRNNIIVGTAIGIITQTYDKKNKPEKIINHNIGADTPKNTTFKVEKKLRDKVVSLFEKRKECVNDIVSISETLSLIDNLPSWCMKEIQSSLERLKDFRKAVKFENNPQKFVEDTDPSNPIYNSIETEKLSELDPITIMAIATVIGIPTIGMTNIFLSGVAATNAALKWLIGDAQFAQKLERGNSFMTLGLLGSIDFSTLFYNKEPIKKEQQEKIIDRAKSIMDIILQRLSILSVEYIKTRKNIKDSRLWIETTQPKDYKKWNEKQKQELERLINNVYNTVRLINERVWV